LPQISDAIRVGGMSTQVEIGYADARGLRPTMEDAIVVRLCLCVLVACFINHLSIQHQHIESKTLEIAQK
jgi:hypothetical protein